ncbi:hypothetical protein PQ459_00520 [Chryseobacterium sp. KACC 21268]|nr:hypothetical protein PQ459_00520 [Chryseobacterium sp. KACC 21268]
MSVEDDPSEDLDFKFFFDNYSPEVEPSSTSDIKSKKEKIALFGGEMNDIDVFLKHEEFRLKYYEFRLKRKTQINENKSKFKDSKNERRLRKENAKKAFWFSSIWAIFIAFFIILHGLKEFRLPFFKSIKISYSVSETEFIFVCGTLTASVLIFYLTVIKNLFPNKPDISNRPD